MHHSHESWMSQAIAVAGLGRRTTAPNPRVGCVLVDDLGQKVAEGAHWRAGFPHAEINALAQVSQARGLTAYVTLEPCAHHGRTGPCCEALAKAGIKRVVIGAKDPNPLVAGKGIAYLENQGIEVIAGVLAYECQALNKGFHAVMLGGLPWVMLKIGQSLDGRTAMQSGESQWITGPKSREQVQYLRAQHSAVLTSFDTLLADQASLNVRIQSWSTGYGYPNSQALGQAYDSAWVRQPCRIVLDRQARLMSVEQADLLAWPLFVSCQMGAPILWVVGVVDADLDIFAKNLQANLPEGLFDWVLVPEKNNHLDLSVLMHMLGNKGFYDIMVEAGATLAAGFLEAELVNELAVFVAPKILGKTARPMVNLSLDRLNQSINFQLNRVEVLEQDIYLSYGRL
jgi:diaminohydroxyphosphoribosylaminopyrimidine deaminase/5-amino-6-(5-phosphoribosylamino)uracil reductase